MMKNSTMPCTMPVIMLPPSLLLFLHFHHVQQHLLATLIVTLPTIGHGEARPGQERTRPDAPRTPRSCQSAHEHVSRHDRAHARPIAVVLPSPPPFAHARAYSPTPS
jgi:hypothetical protein